MKEKALLLGIVLVLATMATANIFSTENTSMKESSNVIHAIMAHGNAHNLKLQGKEIENAFVRAPVASSIPVANTEDTEYHPTIASSGNTFFAGYVYAPSIIEQYVYMAVSTDGGNTFENAGYWNIEGVTDYPSFANWGGNTFYGTFMPDPNTAYTYLMEIQDITDTSTWGLVYWDWSSYGWHDFMEPKIACDNSQNPWEFGVIAFVASTTYTEEELINGPHMFFADPDTENSGWISWWEYPGCQHADATIDKAKDMIYTTYDWYNDTAATWNILVWARGFEDPFDDNVSFLVEIPTTFYAVNPAIAAYNDNVVVVAQSDEHINQDIVCFYSSDGGMTWETSYVTSATQDDLYPDIVVSGNKLICTFVREGNLYYSSSEDWGATWSEPVKINDVDGSVASEFGTSYACSSGVIWTDTRDGNPDVYFDTFPAPIINIEISGLFGVKATVSNTGSIAAENVPWSIKLSGFVPIGSTKEGTISSLEPGQSTTIKTGLVFGIGPTDITVNVGGTTATAHGFVLGPLVLGVK